MKLKNMIKFYVPTWSIFAGPVTNCLQKGEKLVKGVNKLVGKALINLLHHARSGVCRISIITIIIDAPASAYDR